MSRIAELIEELCPNGVVHLSMGATGTFTRGNGIQKKDFLEQGFPAIHYGQIFTRYGLWASETYIFIDKAVASKSKLAQPGDVVIATTSENDEDLAKAVAWLGNSPVAVSSDAMIYSPENLNPKFVSYFLNSTDFQKQKEKFITGTKVKRISSQNFSKIKIPAPPLKIQEEIVRILDRFTLLEAELEAELEARRKQHAHFRDSLLGRKEMESSQVVELKEVCDFEYGLTETAKSEGSVRFIRITDIDENGHLKKDSPAYVEDSPESRKKRLSFGDVVVARTGASFGKSLYFDKPIDASYASFLIKVTCRNGVLDGKYLWHFMQSSYYWKQAEILVSRGGQPQFNSNAISRVKIPVPDMKKQKEIVILLDKFDALANDISSGLPAEIAARRKQYEYYRDQLLTFKELQPEAA